MLSRYVYVCDVSEMYGLFDTRTRVEQSLTLCASTVFFGERHTCELLVNVGVIVGDLGSTC